MYDGYRMCRLIDYCHSFTQRAKEVVSNSLGLVDFAIGLANSLLNFSAQVASEVFLGIQITDQLLSKSFFGLVKITFELVHANYRLPEWQASCKTDFLCTLHRSNNIILFFYFNLHLLKIDFVYLQNDRLVLTFCGHHIPPQLRFCQKLTNFILTPCLVPYVHPEQADFCTGQGPFQAHKRNVPEFKVHSRVVRCTPHQTWS